MGLLLENNYIHFSELLVAKRKSGLEHKHFFACKSLVADQSIRPKFICPKIMYDKTGKSVARGGITLFAISLL